MPKVQIVINNEDRNHHIQLPGRKHGNGNGITPGALLHLTPGVNFVDPERWETARANPSVIALMEQTIQRTTASDKLKAYSGRIGKPKIEVKDVVDASHPLKEMTVDVAIDTVRSTLDRKTIQHWLTQEPRSDVRKAMADQIAQLDAKDETGENQPAPEANKGAVFSKANPPGSPRARK